MDFYVFMNIITHLWRVLVQKIVLLVGSNYSQTNLKSVTCFFEPLGKKIIKIYKSESVCLVSLTKHWHHVFVIRLHFIFQHIFRMDQKEENIKKTQRYHQYLFAYVLAMLSCTLIHRTQVTVPITNIWVTVKIYYLFRQTHTHTRDDW